MLVNKPYFEDGKSADLQASGSQSYSFRKEVILLNFLHLVNIPEGNVTASTSTEFL